MIVSNKYIVLFVIFIIIYWIGCASNKDENQPVNYYEKLKMPIFVVCVLYIMIYSQSDMSQEIYTDPFFLRS